MRRIRSLMTAVVAFSLAAVIAAPAAMAAPTPEIRDAYVAYPRYQTNLSSDAKVTNARSQPSVIANVTDTSVVGGLDKTTLAPIRETNRELQATFIPRSREWQANWVAVDYGRVVTKSRQVPVYGWVQIGDGRALSYEGAPLWSVNNVGSYSHQYMSYAYYKRSFYLWAGNNTNNRSYGAHNEWQPHLGGNDTYWWMNNACDSSLLYTPKYDYADWGEYRAGFHDRAINPYGSGYRGLQARTGQVGGDPLMRWSGPVGYGWYYDCYGHYSYRYQQTGTTTQYYQEWEPDIRMEDHGGWLYRSTYPTSASQQNLSRVELRCTPLGGGSPIVIAATTATENGTAKNSTTTATALQKMQIEVSAASAQVFATTPNNKVTLRTQAGTPIAGMSNIDIPAACYNQVKVPTTPSSGTTPGGQQWEYVVRPS